MATYRWLIECSIWYQFDLILFKWRNINNFFEISKFHYLFFRNSFPKLIIHVCLVVLKWIQMTTLCKDMFIKQWNLFKEDSKYKDFLIITFPRLNHWHYWCLDISFQYLIFNRRIIRLLSPAYTWLLKCCQKVQRSCYKYILFYVLLSAYSVFSYFTFNFIPTLPCCFSQKLYCAV